MRKRLMIGILVGLVIILVLPTTFVFAVLEKDNAQAKKFFTIDKTLISDLGGLPGRALGVEDEKWEKENIYINSNIVNLVGSGYTDKNSQFLTKEENPNPVRILIFGDGYTWGNSNTDRYSTISSLVQDKLDTALGKNVAEVIVVTTNAASTFNHYDYFKNNSIKKYKPDLVIYNYFDNDINPGFNEALICRSETQIHCAESRFNPAEFDPAFQDCIHGEGDSYSSTLGRVKLIFPKTVKKFLDKHCQPLYLEAVKNKYDWLKVQNAPYKSVYINLWEKTVGLLKENFGSTPSAVVKLIPFAPTMEDEKRMLGVFSKSGWDVVPMDTTINYFNTNMGSPTFKEDIQIDAGVGYPSSVLNNLYAQDITKFTLGKIKPERIKEAKASATTVSKPFSVVKYTMPTFNIVNKSLSTTESNIVFDKKLNPTFNQDPDQRGDFPFQHNNCYNLKSSNFLFTLDKSIRTGSVSLHNLPKGEAVEVGLYYYDEKYKRKYLAYGKYKEGQSMVLPSTSIDFSIVLIFPEYSAGCPMDKVIDAPDFNINLRYKAS